MGTKPKRIRTSNLKERKIIYALWWGLQTVKIVEGTVFDGTHKDKTRYSDKTDDVMRECGGTGKHFSNPPINYVPDNMKSGTTCVVCDVEFEVEDSLDEQLSILEVFTRMLLRRHFQRRLLRWLWNLKTIQSGWKNQGEETSNSVSDAKNKSNSCWKA